MGTFNWGPILQLTEISSGTLLSSVFGRPDANTANSFFTAWNFLQYSTDLQVVRELGTNTKNATSNTTGQLIMNSTDYFNNVYPTTANNAWTARYAGSLGNSLELVVFANAAVWTANSGNTADPNYTFANQFNYAPNTSPYVTKVTNGGVTGDEMHVLVVDRLGLISGQANTVLEVWPSLSRLTNSVGPTNTSNYFKQFLYQNSKYVYDTGVPAANTVGWNITISAAASIGALPSDANANIAVLSGGADGTTTSANTVTAQGLFSDPVLSDISLFMLGDGGIVEWDNAISLALQRTDFVVFGSPPLANTTNPAGPAVAINNYVNGLTRSSYGFLDTGWKYQFDQFNNVYRWVPLNGDVAGLCARTDNTNDPWWSPAGLRRGQIQNSIKLAYNPSLADRNSLYQNGVNPVVNFPGEGTLLYGDKTFLNYASAFDHLNVRRLFIVLEKTISKAARAELFEFNDSFTQAQFVNLVTPFLRGVQGRRGITQFKVVCDGTNNTPGVVNANQFVGDIYLVPNKSINYILLHFVAVDTGVSFSTVVGQAF
ncbi:MAG: phage tail sheath subtilisin-like domain-containing protein [Candidatus Dormibacteria bacterium]